ncbi:MAG: class I SAM-dependent methyltransferase [Maribacter sp.]|nr:class I SAM-dependent methyltransferase [Maribacter sp.]
MIDILGNALLDYQKGRYSEDIVTHSSLNEDDILPLPYLFREYAMMPPLEQKALDLCKGKILEIGCGAGSHSLYLQSKAFEVTALDSSAGAIQTCTLRGIHNAIHADIEEFKGQRFDTLLLLMNGIGIVGKLKNLDRFLGHLKSLLQPDAQILLDSSDIIYMFDEDDDGGRWIPDNADYYGEVDFSLEYKGQKSQLFSWLYLDFNTLRRAAHFNHFSCDLVMKGEHYDYLAILRVKK